MNRYIIDITYVEGSGPNTYLDFEISAIDANSAFITAAGKVFALFCGTNKTIKNLTITLLLADSVPENDEGEEEPEEEPEQNNSGVE